MKTLPVILTLLTAFTCAAADPASTELPSVGGSVIRVLGALALVFAIFFLGVWLLRNWQKILVQRGVASRLSIIEAKSIGQRQTLMVVGYDRQRMLIASSPAGVTLLASLPPAEEAPPVSTPAAPPPSFSDVLRKVMGGK